MHQRAILMSIAKIWDSAAVRGARIKHFNICTTTTSTTTTMTTTASATIPIICRTSQRFRENRGSGNVIRQLSVL